MAYIGMKHPVFAPIESETNGVPTYGEGIVVGRAISAELSLEMADAPLYADDVIAERERGFLSGTLTIGVDDISKEAQLAWLGTKEITGTGEEDSYIEDAANYTAPIGGFGFVRVRKYNNVRSIIAYWYYKTTWVQSSESAQTKGESIEWQTPTVEGTIETLDNEQQAWRKYKEFTSEAEAIAWLDELAQIGQGA